MRGRIRTVKPEVFSDEILGDLEQQTGLPVFRVFVGLWCFADREGRFEWLPRALRGAIMPCWDGDMEAALDALASKSYIIRYTVLGKDYGYIRAFSKHQRVNQREADSDLPSPSAHACTVMHVQGSEAPTADAVGNETSGVETRGEREGDCPHAPVPPVLTLDQPCPHPTRKGRHETYVDAESGDGVCHACGARGQVFTKREADPPSVPGLTRVVGAGGVARTLTMPSEEPPKAYLDDCSLAGVNEAQARSTWKHYWGAGLPDRGVEKLVPWMVQRAIERRNSLSKVERKHGSAQPNAGKTGWEHLEVKS